MKITRLTELSLYHAIQDALAIKRTGEIAKGFADLVTYNLKYKFVQPQFPIVVYVNDTPVTSGFTIDCTNGIIHFALPLQLADVVKIDYFYCPVNVYDESKNPAGDDFQYPAVAVYQDGTDRVGYELGSSKRQIIANWIVDIWTDRGGERSDYADVIEEMFESPIQITDYNVAFPVLEDGSINPSFNLQSQLIGYAVADSINSHKGGSLDVGDKPVYLAQIFVTLLVNT